MATSSPNLDAVVQVPPIGQNGLLDYRWRAFMKALQGAVPIPGSGFVVDGSLSSYSAMVLFQGPDASKSGTPATGDIYFALDTGRIYWAQSGTWKLLSEELVGDVTKPANSNVTTLETVLLTPGTYGSSTQIPVPTLDSKGRVIGITQVDVSAGTVTPGGPNGALQFNNSGALDGSSLILYNPLNGSFVFSNPSPTREALSPLTTKGDIFVRNATVSTRLPVGTDGQVLFSDSTSPNGVAWGSIRTVDVEFQWNVVSEFVLLTVPANVLVKSITTYIEVAFDGTGATLTIGDAGDNSRLQNNIDPYEAAGYQSTPADKYGTDTVVNLYINPGTATQGNGLISIELQERA